MIINHGIKIYMPGISDPMTLQQLSLYLGKTVITTQSKTWQKGGGWTRNEAEPEVDLAVPGELRQLYSDEVLAIVTNYPPMRLWVPARFESDDIRAMIDPDVAAAMDEAFGEDETPEGLTKRQQRKAATARRARRTGVESTVLVTVIWTTSKKTSTRGRPAKHRCGKTADRHR